jgi:hypothetical protein
MRLGIATVAVTAAVTLLTACEEGTGGTGLGLVAGPDSYRAAWMVYESEVGLAIDLVEEGAIFELSLDDGNGTFRSTFQYDAIDVDISGTYDIEGDQIAFSDDPLEADDQVFTRTFAYAMVGDTIVFTNASVAFDVDGDGAKEIASLEIWLEPI